MTTVISVRGRDRAELLADPAFAYVGRRCAGWRGSIYGNPFKPGISVFEAIAILGRPPGPSTAVLRLESPLTVEMAVECYEAFLRATPELLTRAQRELVGLKLGCWCCDWSPGQPVIRPCHGIVLARIANESELPSA